MFTVRHSSFTAGARPCIVKTIKIVSKTKVWECNVKKNRTMSSRPETTRSRRRPGDRAWRKEERRNKRGGTQIDQSEKRNQSSSCWMPPACTCETFDISAIVSCTFVLRYICYFNSSMWILVREFFTFSGHFKTCAWAQFTQGKMSKHSSYFPCKELLQCWDAIWKESTTFILPWEPRHVSLGLDNRPTLTWISGQPQMGTHLSNSLKA